MWGDEGKLRQVLINLLGNAVKFTEQGEVTLRVKAEGGDMYSFEVQDTGPGIAPERLEAIFDPFQQDRRTAALGGTGLGLAIARRSVELMGGYLGAESTLDKGARFYFTLELPPAEDVPRRRESDGWDDVERLAAGISVTALVVDDIETNRDILRQLLERIGVEVQTAEGGEQALRMVREQIPDIVFMDIRMPDMDGSETRRRLVEEHGDDAMRIVTVTASAFEHQRRAFLDEGFNAYIDKPLRMGQLYACLADQLGVEFERGPAEERQTRPSAADWGALVLPKDLAEGLDEALTLQSVTDLRRHIAALEKLGKSGGLLAAHLSDLSRRFDMEAIRDVLDGVDRE